MNDSTDTPERSGLGRTALVTGASSGLGAATAVELARRGYAVGLVARRHDRLIEVLEQCVEHSPDSRHWVADLEDLEAAASLIPQVWRSFGHLDVLVHNAAIPMRKGVDRLTNADVERVMAINFLAPVRMTLAVLPYMIERGSGTIVNVSSVGGRLGIANESAYCASKFALCGWSESMAVDLDGSGVKVKLILPGAIDTEIWDLPGNDPSPYHGEMATPESVAVGLADAIDSDRFEHYLPAEPDMKAVVEFKTKDPDTFLAGVVAFARQSGGA